VALAPGCRTEKVRYLIEFSLMEEPGGIPLHKAMISLEVFSCNIYAIGQCGSAVKHAAITLILLTSVETQKVDD
jgi:hypothetical protein